MCKNCYHKSGRDKKATNCSHSERALYALGLCKQCYQASYSKKRPKKRKRKGTKDKVTNVKVEAAKKLRKKISHRKKIIPKDLIVDNKVINFTLNNDNFTNINNPFGNSQFNLPTNITHDNQNFNMSSNPFNELNCYIDNFFYNQSIDQYNTQQSKDMTDPTLSNYSNN